MGSEIIFPAAAILGIGLFAFLAFRSFSKIARPYAAPTLLAAIAFAFVLNDRAQPPHNDWVYWLDWFCLGAIVFGIHAHAIRWLVQRQIRPSVPNA